MPVDFENSDHFPQKTLVPPGPAEPIIPIEVTEKRAPGFMNWEERLRTTEELLQKLSGGYS